ALTDVAAGMGEQTVAAKADMGRASCREGVAPKHLAAELDELPGWREPAQLYPIIVILGVEKYSVRQRLVGKIPGVRMLLVQIADTGEEPASPHREPPWQAGRLHEGFLDRQVVLGIDG